MPALLAVASFSLMLGGMLAHLCSADLLDLQGGAAAVLVA